MKGLLALFMIVLSGCGASAPSAATTTSAKQAQPRVPISPSPTAPTLGLSCRLPLAQPQPGSFNGVFVRFPGGKQSADPAVTLPANNGATFTRRYGQWLSAPLSAVSPDSSKYAYGDRVPTPFDHIRIHVVDVLSKADRIVYNQSSTDRGYFVIDDYQADGIYVADVGPSGEGRSGLWLLDPGSGTVRQITPVGQPPSMVGFQAIGAGGAWYTDLAPGDQPPFEGIAPADRLMRFDLTTRAVTSWFQRPGSFVEVLGTDATGHPIVRTSVMADSLTSISESLWVLTAPNVARQIYAGPGSRDPRYADFIGEPLQDDHGIWLGSRHGVYLVTGSGQLERVSEVAGLIAGRCS